MGSGENLWASLVGLAAFADWMLFRHTVPRLLIWANVLSELGILPPAISTVSLDDDGLQQELICPAISSARLSARTRVASRRSPSDSSINAFVEAGHPMTSGSFVVDQAFKIDTHFHAPIPIHSPFASSDFRFM